MSLYQLKPAFQSYLRPLVGKIYRLGVTANQITLLAAVGSLLLCFILIAYGINSPWLFFLVPLWLFKRMALNAVDGMLAREHGQKSPLGAYLNEVCDIVSDGAMILPFLWIQPFGIWSIAVVLFLTFLSEFVGILGTAVGASRRYDGPMGKSDRALVFGALAVCVGLLGGLPDWFAIVMPLIAVLLCITIYRRVALGLREVKSEL